MGRHRRHCKRSVVFHAIFGVGLLLPVTGDIWQRAQTPVPVVAKAPTIEINPDDWQSLAMAVRRQANRFPGVSGYVIKDLKTNQIVSANEAESFPSASLIKLPILCAAFQAAEEGKFSLTQTHVLTRADKRGGSGVLKIAPIGTVLTNRELLELMIVNSDNTAANLIVQQLGFDYLQDAFMRLGLLDTQIHPDGFRLTNRHVPDDNMTSPRDMALLLEKIYERQLVSPVASDQMLDILKHQHLRDRLPRFLPTGWLIAHKTGLLRKACHDVGIVFSPQGDYMICVLTSHDRTYKLAKRFIASMGRITYDYYQGSLPVHPSSLHRPVMQTSRAPAPVSPAS